MSLPSRKTFHHGEAVKRLNAEDYITIILVFIILLIGGASLYEGLYNSPITNDISMNSRTVHRKSHKRHIYKHHAYKYKRHHSIKQKNLNNSTIGNNSSSNQSTLQNNSQNKFTVNDNTKTNTKMSSNPVQKTNNGFKSDSSVANHKIIKPAQTPKMSSSIKK